MVYAVVYAEVKLAWIWEGWTPVAYTVVWRNSVVWRST